MLRSALLITFIAACGNPDATVDATVTHDAPQGSPDASPDAPAARHGEVSVAKGTGVSGARASVSAQLTDVPVLGTTVGVDGPCTLSHSEPDSSRLSAGIITVSGTTTPFTMTPSGTSPSVHYATSPTPPTDPYAAGATITFSAAGGEFPAFSGSVIAPAALAGFTVPTTVSRAGYTATWTAAAGPQIWVIVLDLANDTLYCRVDDTGTFTVPASSFALFPATTTQILVAVARVAEQDIVAPDVLLFAVSQISSGVIPLTP